MKNERKAGIISGLFYFVLVSVGKVWFRLVKFVSAWRSMNPVFSQWIC